MVWDGPSSQAWAKWGASLVVDNSAALAGEGVTATPSTGAMDPAYTGTLAISAASGTAPGSYRITLKASGDDPSVSPVTFQLTMTAAATGTTTSSTTTATTTTTSSSYSYGY